ncbi:MAG TPA: SDR family oxidoreductase [Micromonosporaceae bacterium]|nr:SDR family oxidoreductase [Micromonosporaceae bacterium]
MTEQVVVITGASAGVGRAVAAAFARRGARLGLLARGAAGLAAAEKECAELGAARVCTAEVDISDATALDAAADRIAGDLGPPDIWVNNAMVSVFARVWDITPAEFRRVIEVNYLGSVHGTLAALRTMRPAGRGTIVQVGSSLAYRGIPLQSAYCASKHAVQGFLDSLRAELLAEHPGIRLTMVNLPAVNTPQFSWVRTRLPRHPQPVPPIYQPEVAARAILWAADRAPRELNVGAPTVVTRVLDVLVPGLVERYLARRGFDAQQTPEPVDLARWRDNLDAPVDGDTDHGAHGEFDDRAKRRSPQLWLATHKGAVAAGAAAALGTAAASTWVRRAAGD